MTRPLEDDSEFVSALLVESDSGQGRTDVLAIPILTLILIFALWASYKLITAPSFSYLLYTYSTPPLIPSLISISAVLLISASLPRSFSRTSQVVYCIIFIVVIVPFSIVPQLLLGGILASLGQNQLLLAQISVDLSFVMIGGIIRLPPPRLRRFHVSPQAFWAVIVLLMAALYVVLLGATGLSLHLVKLNDVYGTRSQFKSAISSSSLAGYAAGWLSTVLNPLLMAFGMRARRWIPMAAGLSGQLLIYSLSGQKSVFFSAAVVVLISWLLHPKRIGHSARNLIGGITALIAMCYLLDRIFAGYFWNSIFVRRFLVTPAFLTGAYFDFFSKNPKVHWSTSILQGVVGSPYGLDTGSVVGRYLYPLGADNANVNLFGDAFANFGLLGLIPFSAILAVILLLIDGATRDRDLRLPSMVMGLAAVTLTQSALLTSFLTFGILLTLVVFLFLPPDEELGLGAGSRGLGKGPDRLTMRG